jgi:hypothetical protein
MRSRPQVTMPQFNGTVPQPEASASPINPQAVVSSNPTLDALGHLIWAFLSFVYHLLVDCCLYNIWYFCFSTWIMALISTFVIVSTISIWFHYCTLYEKDRHFRDCSYYIGKSFGSIYVSLEHFCTGIGRFFLFIGRILGGGIGVTKLPEPEPVEKFPLPDPPVPQKTNTGQPVSKSPAAASGAAGVPRGNCLNDWFQRTAELNTAAAAMLAAARPVGSAAPPAEATDNMPSPSSGGSPTDVSGANAGAGGGADAGRKRAYESNNTIDEAMDIIIGCPQRLALFFRWHTLINAGLQVEITAETAKFDGLLGMAHVMVQDPTMYEYFNNRFLQSAKKQKHGQNGSSGRGRNGGH